MAVTGCAVRGRPGHTNVRGTVRCENTGTVQCEIREEDESLQISGAGQAA